MMNGRACCQLRAKRDFCTPVMSTLKSSQNRWNPLGSIVSGSSEPATLAIIFKWRRTVSIKPFLTPFLIPNLRSATRVKRRYIHILICRPLPIPAYQSRNSRPIRHVSPAWASGSFPRIVRLGSTNDDIALSRTGRHLAFLCVGRRAGRSFGNGGLFLPTRHCWKTETRFGSCGTDFGGCSVAQNRSEPKSWWWVCLIVQRPFGGLMGVPHYATACAALVNHLIPQNFMVHCKERHPRIYKIH